MASAKRLRLKNPLHVDAQMDAALGPAEEVVNDRPRDAPAPIAIASPAIRAPRRRATRPRRGRVPRRDAATIISQITRPKAASPKLPSAAPTASSAAAFLCAAPRSPADPLSPCVPGHAFSINVPLAGKDRGKGEKQAANDGPEACRDEACDCGHHPDKHVSDEILVPTRLKKGGRLELDDHQS